MPGCKVHIYNRGALKHWDFVILEPRTLSMLDKHSIPEIQSLPVCVISEIGKRVTWLIYSFILWNNAIICIVLSTLIVTKAILTKLCDYVISVLSTHIYMLNCHFQDTSSFLSLWVPTALKIHMWSSTEILCWILSTTHEIVGLVFYSCLIFMIFVT